MTRDHCLMTIEIKEDGNIVARVTNGIALGSVDKIKKAAAIINRIEERPTWSAKIPPHEMAVVLCADLTKKLRILGKVSADHKKLILEGLADGLIGNAITHPQGGLPPVLHSMHPAYCDEWFVGDRWARIAKEWPEG